MPPSDLEVATFGRGQLLTMPMLSQLFFNLRSKVDDLHRIYDNIGGGHSTSPVHGIYGADRYAANVDSQIISVRVSLFAAEFLIFCSSIPLRDPQAAGFISELLDLVIF